MRHDLRSATQKIPVADSKRAAMGIFLWDGEASEGISRTKAAPPQKRKRAVRQITPCAIMALATFMKPATFAPRT